MSGQRSLFGLGNTQTIDEPKAANGSTDAKTLNEIRALLASLRDSRPLEEGLTIPEDIVELAADIQRKIDHWDTQTLERTVDYSINASEAMAYTAELSTHVRATDGWAQTMSTGVEEMESSINLIAENAKATADTITDANNALRDCETVTHATLESNREIGVSFERMQEAGERLAEAADKISSFVNTIDGLSKQTNLLALNATIEAARAGEAGKGFSVVASEVKNLSGQTQKATDDIRALIGDLLQNLNEVNSTVESVGGLVEGSLQRSEEAAQHITQVRTSAGEIDTQARQNAELLEQQSQANHEIAKGVLEVAHHSAKASTAIENVIRSVSGSEKIVAQQFDELQQRSIPGFVLLKAKADHILWKKHLAEIMAGLSKKTSAQMSNYHECGLGKWYDNITSPALIAMPAFQKLLPAHEEVHDQGKRCADLFHGGDRNGALEAYTSMSEASERVLACIDELIRS
ncbi:methyl-accepting chemotaxis protein [Pseudovibrio sp. SPO723]|uniref:methyl-accepting chemotaxis protein n=1 Tax=Nesiotobacter zosterae TaxID=392721 RepID=UPI0029C45049|nr:methyl-accepting chemotaxis protein [Pseudovibrio sp. SPO723]MDX5594446.1 methyl-accepting chemotaxis protein [Pseudovibrio sp. SPO723]